MRVQVRDCDDPIQVIIFIDVRAGLQALFAAPAFQEAAPEEIQRSVRDRLPRGASPGHAVELGETVRCTLHAVCSLAYGKLVAKRAAWCVFRFLAVLRDACCVCRVECFVFPNWEDCSSMRDSRTTYHVPRTTYHASIVVKHLFHRRPPLAPAWLGSAPGTASGDPTTAASRVSAAIFAMLAAKSSPTYSK